VSNIVTTVVTIVLRLCSVSLEKTTADDHQWSSTGYQLKAAITKQVSWPLESRPENFTIFEDIQRLNPGHPGYIGTIAGFTTRGATVDS
jgi:hypothetical protein